MLFDFWVLSMLHYEGRIAHSVYVDLNTLMQYWGPEISDHSNVECCEIKQERICCPRFTKEQETLIEVEVFSFEEKRCERLYFMDILDVYEWQQRHEHQEVGLNYEFKSMTVRTLHINYDPPMVKGMNISRERTS